MSMSITKCQDIYDSIIALNKELRKEPSIVDAAKYMSLYNFMRNFATVKVNLGRCTGKTFYINYKNDYGNDIILAPHAVHNRFTDYSHSIRLIQLNDSFNVDSLAGMDLSNVSTIWVDDASHIKPSVLDQALLYLYRNANQTVVLLG